MSHFRALCHPVPIEEHIMGVEQDRVWGTDLEIHAAATLWQVKICLCTKFFIRLIPTGVLQSTPINKTDDSHEVPRAAMPPRDVLLEVSLWCNCWSTWIPLYLPPIPDIPDVYVIVKALPQVCIKNTARRECRMVNTARGEAECCIYHETPPDCCVSYTQA